MNKSAISLYYLRAVTPLSAFIFLFNELSFFFITYRNTQVFPWMHLTQSCMIAAVGYLILLMPALQFTSRLEKTAWAGDSVPDDIKLTIFFRCIRSLTIITGIMTFVIIVLPRITGLFFIQKNSDSFIFLSRSVLDIIISLILWGISLFLSLFYFKSDIENQTEIAFIKKYSHLNIRRKFSFGFIMITGILLSFLISAAFTISGGAFFAESILRYTAAKSLSLFIVTGIFSGTLIAVLIILFIRVYQKLHSQKIGRTVGLLNDIKKASHKLMQTNIISLDEFSDLCENITLLMENTQMVTSDFKQKTELLKTSLTTIKSIYEESKQPLIEIAAASAESTEANSQITYLSRSDKNVHNLNATAKMMEEQILAQEEMVNRTSIAISQMSSSIALIVQTIYTATQLSEKLKNYSVTGNRAIKEAKTAIDEIQYAAQSVSEILTVIQRIASQTNLLSMNASIEASHAGASGSGFALVAQSVRALADASTKSAKKIENHINIMGEWIQVANQTIGAITKTFNSIQQGIKENSELIETISGAMNEEESAAHDTLTAIESVVASVRNIKTKFQTQKEAAINVEETMTLILDLSDRMQQLLSSEQDMSDHLNLTIDSMTEAVACSQKTLTEIERTASYYAS